MPHVRGAVVSARLFTGAAAPGDTEFAQSLSGACGKFLIIAIAGDDNELALVALAVRAISQPPFPLERLTPQPNRKTSAGPRACCLPTTALAIESAKTRK